MAIAAIACGDTSAFNRHLFGGDGPADGGVHSGGVDGSSAPPRSGCSKDTDCKGDRICENGICVAPGTGGNAAASGGNAPSAGGDRGDGGDQASGGRPSTGGAAMAGTSSGGAPSGGTSSGGVSSGGAMTGGTGSGGKPAMCPAGQKPCNNKCVSPSPAFGCDAVSCTACGAPVPTQGYATCENSQCSFECLSGYIKVAGGCYIEGGSGGFGFGGYSGFGGYGGFGAYGNGGRVGTGGGAPCIASDCHNTCDITNGGPCCTTSGKCGCLLLNVPGTCM